MDVHMDMVCPDFDNSVNEANYDHALVDGILYAIVDVQGQGYPPPTELVPLAKIAEYRDWDDTGRKRAWAAAQKLANVQYHQRK
jgi:hypothetical protein